MGIVNVTPDSFSNDGCWRSDNKRSAYLLARKHIRDGADVIDIGGESTRPGADKVPVKEEMDRVIPLVELLIKKTKIPISVDTYKPMVAKAALDAGANIINNIMGTNPEISLLKMVKRYDAVIVLMHIKGTPKHMQKNIQYRNLIEEITNTLQKSIEKCLEIGIKSDKIIVDPGIGFGKTVEHNLEILNRLGDLRVLNQPLLIGSSRKSFIGKVLKKEVGQRLVGTMATVSAAILNGVHIVRVHDVKAIQDTVFMSDAIVNEHYN